MLDNDDAGRTGAGAADHTGARRSPLFEAHPERFRPDGSLRTHTVVVTDVRTEPIEAAAALAIDHRAQLANEAGERAETRIDQGLGVPRAVFVDAEGQATALPTLGGATSFATAISPRGDVAGVADTPNGAAEGFVWSRQAAQVTGLGRLAGDGFSAASFWLGEAFIVGQADEGGRERAVFWTREDGLLDLNTVARDFGVHLGRPLGVRDGRLLAEGVDAEGRPVLATVSLLVVETLSGDLTGDGVVDQADVAAFVRMLEAQDPAGDLNGDGVVDARDFAEIAQQMGRRAREAWPGETGPAGAPEEAAQRGRR